MSALPIAISTRQTSSRSASRSGRALLALVVAAGAVIVLLVAGASSAELALYWAVGLSIGAVLSRGRVCFAGAFRDLVLMRNGVMLRAVLVGIAVALPAYALIQYRAVPNAGFGALPPNAHITPLGLNLVVGGLLFGVGMVVAGGCVSGTLYRIGEGYLASWASLGGILVGLQLASYSWNIWWIAHIQYAPMVWLPASVGYAGAVALSLAALAAAYMAILWWESRDAGPPMPPLAGRAVVAPIGFAAQLAAIKNTILVKGWPPLIAVAALAWLNVASYLIDHPIGVTGELASWADRAASLLAIGAPALLGTDLFAGCNLVLENLGLVSSRTMLDGGLIVGAFLAASGAGEFKLRAPRQKRRYVQSAVGGVAMGYGAGIAVGCTLGAFFSAIPSLGLNGWVFGLALLAGAAVGVQVIRRIA